MPSLTHYLRTFIKAVRLTAQGKKPEQLRYPKLYGWVQTGLAQVNQIFKEADAIGLTANARQSWKMTIDRRDVSMHVILEAVRFHFTTEYPSLMNAYVDHNLTTLYALNIDDQYRVKCLAESPQLPEALRHPIQQLAQHLQNIPSSKEV